MKNTEKWLFYKKDDWTWLFLSEDQKPIEWSKEVERNTVTAIIKHPKKDAYLVLNRPTGQRRFLWWWVESWESPRQAIEREVKEESGFIDILNKGQLGWNISAYFHHQTKFINLLAHNHCFIILLQSEMEIEMSANEKQKHQLIWIDKNQVNDYCNAPVGNMYRNRYIHGFMKWITNYDELDNKYVLSYQWEIYYK